MKRFMLLSANNVNTEIDAEPYPSLAEAQQAMELEWEDTKQDLEDVEEAELGSDSASLFTGGDGGDLYYWQIKEIEV